MRRTIAIIYTVLAILAYLLGYMANRGPEAGPLNYVFVVVLGVPWSFLLSWLLGDSVSTSFVPLVGVLINGALLWWWALRRPRAAIK